MNDHVDILGVRYTIERRDAKDDPALGDRCDAYHDSSVRRIVVGIFKKEADSIADIAVYERECLRHEIIHAFLYQSGLDGSALAPRQAWATNEEMVDWFAIQHEKIHAAFLQAGALDAEG